LDLDYIQQNVDLYVSQKIDLSSSKILVEKKKSMENRLEKTQSFIQKLERIIQHYSEENLSLYDVLRKNENSINELNEKISNFIRLTKIYKNTIFKLRKFIANNGLEYHENNEQTQNKEQQQKDIEESLSLSNQTNETTKTEIISLVLEKDECVICQERKKSIAIIPCGHYCCCEKCVTQLSGLCPVCRTVFNTTCRIFQ